MTARFCRVFETERGQIVVLKEYHDEGTDPWVIAFLCQPDGAAGPCIVALAFSEEEKRDQMFDRLTVGTALRLTACVYSCFPDGEFSDEALQQLSS